MLCERIFISGSFLSRNSGRSPGSRGPQVDGGQSSRTSGRCSLHPGQRRVSCRPFFLLLRRVPVRVLFPPRVRPPRAAPFHPLLALSPPFYGSESAPAGHSSVQGPHSRQSFSLMRALLSTIITYTGQTYAQFPHPVHFSLSTMTAIEHSSAQGSPLIFSAPAFQSSA